MLNGFYNYIAKNIDGYFQKNSAIIRSGERYCLRLDNEEMVKGVYDSLEKLLEGRTGNYEYGDKYSTFTIPLTSEKEVVVAARIDGMTDDFLATLRNAELTDRNYPILMLTTSTIDTITSGTADLAAMGMPFHAVSMNQKIQEAISRSGFQLYERCLIEAVLEKKQNDRYSDHSSLYEYADLLNVIEGQRIDKRDFQSFGLFPSDEIKVMTKTKDIETLITDNFNEFEKLGRAVEIGDYERLRDDYGSKLEKLIKDNIKSNHTWYTGLTYENVRKEREARRNEITTPLEIEDSDITVHAAGPDFFQYVANEDYWIRSDGTTKTKKRSKNLIIFNPPSLKQNKIVIQIKANKNISRSLVRGYDGSETLIKSGMLYIEIKPDGCLFTAVDLMNEGGKVTHKLKICVLDLEQKYISRFKTHYIIKIYKNLKRSFIQLSGISDELLINPGQENVVSRNLEEEAVYSCVYDRTLRILLDSEEAAVEQKGSNFRLAFGSMEIHCQILPESIQINELTGAMAFKRKFGTERWLEFSDEEERIIDGTTPFYVKGPFREYLRLETEFIKNGYLAIEEYTEGNELKVREYELPGVPHEIRNKYKKLADKFRERGTLPSLCRYDSEIREIAEGFISSVVELLDSVQNGDVISEEINHVLMIGCTIRTGGKGLIKMGPLQPLNIMYQLMLLQEKEVHCVRQTLISRLNPLYLLPYIQGPGEIIYQTLEQKEAPEWRLYAPARSLEYQGSEIFVERLIRDKIKQYNKHFWFLFDRGGSGTIHINLIGMGDCKEVLKGLLAFYSEQLRENIAYEEMMSFQINIYTDSRLDNVFNLLSDGDKLSEFIKSYSEKSLADELFVIVTSRVRCFFHKSVMQHSEYAHLTFYEMGLSNKMSDSRMDAVTTGVSLEGLVSGVSSTLIGNWYKTGFGTRFASENKLRKIAELYNALYRVAFSSNSYSREVALSSETLRQDEEFLSEIYEMSNWVVFVRPKVDLSFFSKAPGMSHNLMIIHYSDQYTSASGYDDITVTQKVGQYSSIIKEELNKKGLSLGEEETHRIINMFNAVNGEWLLKMISYKKLKGAMESHFSREKISILSAIKVALAFNEHPEITWIPISLEEILRVSGSVGLSKKEGLLSAKNLGFEQGVTCDDFILVGVENKETLQVYLHPVEVKIGQNQSNVLEKAAQQVLNTYHGFYSALWPEENRDTLERKLYRNFFMQIVVVCCEKLRMYEVYPAGKWERVSESLRYKILNEDYDISRTLEPFIGKGTVISFGEGHSVMSTHTKNDVRFLEFPRRYGSEYLVREVDWIYRGLKDMPEMRSHMLDEVYEQHRVIQDEDIDILIPEKISQGKIEMEQGFVDKHFEQRDADENCGCRSKNTTSELQNPSVEESQGNMNMQQTISENKEAYSADRVSSEPVNPVVVEPSTEEYEGIKVLFGTDSVTGEPLYWYPNDTDRLFHTNTGIIGTMGTGKTQFTKSLITQIYQNQRINVGDEELGILIFDYKGDYNQTNEDFFEAVKPQVRIPHRLPFNPLALVRGKTSIPLLPVHTANAFKDIISKIYNLGPKQEGVLFNCIMRAYELKGISSADPATWSRPAPTIKTVYRIYEEDEEIKKNDVLAVAMSGMDQYQLFEEDSEKAMPLFDMLKGVVVIDLSSFNPSLQNLVVAIILNLFYSQMQISGSSKLQGRFRQLTKMILVDEADNFMKEGFPVLKKIMKEGREFGVGTILSTQLLKHFGNGEDDYSSYILSWVVHNVSDLKNSDVEFVFKTDPRGDEGQRLYQDIKMLKKHHSIVKIAAEKPRYIKDKAFWELYREMCLEKK